MTDAASESVRPGPSALAVAETYVGAVLDAEARLDAALAQSAAGHRLDDRELLRLQAAVYAYDQRVEVATRVADRVAGAARRLLDVQL